MIDLKKLQTESNNLNTKNIDNLDTIDILKLINEEDKIVPKKVESALPQIEALVEELSISMKKGGFSSGHHPLWRFLRSSTPNLI